MTSLQDIHQLLKTASRSCNPAMFFKAGPGGYAEHDQFLGISNPVLRQISKTFATLPLNDIQTLLNSPFNEERLLALFILVHQYQKVTDKEPLYQFYLNNLKHVNNWNLVDSSAHLIIGAHLLTRDKTLLTTLSHSKNLWEKRVAIVATLYFIKKDQFDWTFRIALNLLNDTHDLIHKAVGWMLREAGKRNVDELTKFLDKHHTEMPRTMLRYAIEKFDPKTRATYLLRK